MKISTTTKIAARISPCRRCAYIMQINSAFAIPITRLSLAHILFTLENINGITISKAKGELGLKVNTDKGKDAAEVIHMLTV